MAVQNKFIQTIKGLEKARILRPGYGIEHGVVDARELQATLESKKIEGLYFAGQVNGTTGYEEASAQGIISGVNAYLKVKKKKPFVLRRDQAYIGVLIDDLVSKGTDEPYRMFTSRSEFRLSLREANADLRLSGLGYALGLLPQKSYNLVLAKKQKLKELLAETKATKIMVKGKSLSLFSYLKRPNIDFRKIKKHLSKRITNLALEREVEVEAKYETFLKRELIWQKEIKNLDRVKLRRINYSKVPSVSREIIEKLTIFKPSSLGEALRISGVTPAAIVNIHNYLKKKDSNTHR